MRRRDELTYDLGTPRTSGPAGVNPRLLALLIIVLALAVALVVWTARSAGSSVNATAPDHDNGLVASSRPSPAIPTPAGKPSLLLAGSDADQADHAPPGSTTAAVRFVAAWLDRVPRTRKAELRQTATSGLAEELMLTSAENIPRASAKGPPRLADASEFSVQFVQSLSDGMRIRVYLVADPQSRFGWMATSVEQA